MFIINSTLFIQILHFIIAYFLIRTLLFGPAVAILGKEDALLDSLVTTRQEQLDLIAARKDELANQWRACQEYCLARIPLIKRKKQSVTEDIQKVPHPLPLAESIIAEYVSFFANHIERKVDHVH